MGYEPLSRQRIGNLWNRSSSMKEMASSLYVSTRYHDCVICPIHLSLESPIKEKEQACDSRIDGEPDVLGSGPLKLIGRKQRQTAS